MKAIMKLFDSELDRCLDIENYIDCRSSPQRLLRELKISSQVKKLTKHIQGTTQNPFKIMRLMSILNLLLIYDSKWFELVEETLKLRLSRDQWLNNRFIEPYFRFLIKCCTSREMYMTIRTHSFKKTGVLDSLFYTINMLKLLFKVVQKMPLLGRYYKPKNNGTVSSAVEIIALQAQKLYGCFKYALTQILYHKERYINSREQEKYMRGVLVDQLTFINEEMKKLFLDKYFYPLGRGIGVKLFRPEEESKECQKTVKAIMNDHQETERQRRQVELEKTLFPGSGLVNWNFYEETLLGGPLNQTMGMGETSFKELDDLDLSQEYQREEEEEQIQRDMKKGVSQKETNTGIDKKQDL